MTTAKTASDAFRLYEQALAADALIQGNWHKEQDGRHLACALGVLGEEIDDPKKCPAQIMPRWLAQMVPWFFDRQKFDDAKDWGLRFYTELARINGLVPFSVVHDWQATVVAPLAIEVATKRSRPTEPHEAKRDLHLRALSGDLAKKDEWAAVLRPADAYAYADAYADAYAYYGGHAIKRLADGMVDCLARVPTPTQAAS